MREKQGENADSGNKLFWNGWNGLGSGIRFRNTMKLDKDALPEHIKKLNPHLFVGGVDRPFRKQDITRALAVKPKKRVGCSACMVISLVRYSERSLDDDNLRTAIKPLRDAISGTLAIDDADSRIRWEYGQIETRGQPGIMVTIEEI